MGIVMMQSIGKALERPREVSLTRIAPWRSRMSVKASRTVLKTSRAGDRPAEFDILDRS